MVAGRAVYGLGSETLYALRATYTVLWFFDQEISLAMGLATSIPYAFSYFAGLLYPMWADKYSAGSDLGIARANYSGLLFCIGSLVAGIILACVERQRAISERIKKLVLYTKEP